MESNFIALKVLYVQLFYYYLQIILIQSHNILNTISFVVYYLFYVTIALYRPSIIKGV